MIDFIGREKEIRDRYLTARNRRHLLSISDFNLSRLMLRIVQIIDDFSVRKRNFAGRDFSIRSGIPFRYYALVMPSFYMLL